MQPADYVSASDGTGEAVRAIVTTERLVGATTLIVDSVAKWPLKFIATSGTLDPLTGLLDDNTLTVFKGTLTGSIITIDEFAPGYADVGHTVNQIVVLKPSTLWADIVRAYLDELTAFAEASTHVALVKNETVSGVKDGSNTVFTIVGSALTGSVELYKNGVRQLPGVGNDYTVAGQTITMALAPLTGTVLLADYATSTSQFTSPTTVGIRTNEAVTGTVNGTNKIFTTISSYVPGTLEVWVNGLKQIPVTHYVETTPTSGVFTFDDAPITGDNIIVNYQNSLSFAIGDADTVDTFHASPVATANTLLPLNSSAKYPLEVTETQYMFLNRTSDLSVSNASWVELNMLQAVHNTMQGGTYWSIADHNRISFPVSGIYAINIWCVWANSGGGTLRALTVSFNATTVGGSPDYRDISDYRMPVAFNNKNNIYLEVPVTAGEYLCMFAYQNSGGTLSIASAPGYNAATKVTVRKVGEL